MKKLIPLLLLAVGFVGCFDQTAEAQFLFPRLRAARAEAQTRALIAVNNQQAVRLALRGNVVVAPQKVVVSPSFAFRSYVPRQNVVFFSQPSYSAAFVAPRYYAAPVVQPYFQPLQALAVPSYQPVVSSYSLQVNAGGGGFCGF